MSDVLNATIREGLGTAKTRRLRQQGNVPVVLYGHGKENLHLSVPAAEVTAVIRHGGKLVNLAGAVSESAIISVVQWDPLGSDILHLDLTRVDADEKVTVQLPIETRGTAPGVTAGGSIKYMMHEIELECAATDIPESIVINLNDVQLHDTITVGDLVLPKDATVHLDAAEVVLQCIEATEAREEEEEVGGVTGAEPEVIGKADEDKGDDDS